MTTDFQRARVALGTRLRELRLEAGLTGLQLASRLGWPQSKVSKLENGNQTPALDDLRAWAAGTERPEATTELTIRLRSLESRTRSWRRQLAAGHRPVQETINAEHERSTVVRAWQNAMVVGMLQTPEYARSVFAAYADLYDSGRDLDEAVQARIRRQSLLNQPGKQYHFVMWEGALRAQICPPSVLAAQLERLMTVTGTNNVRLGIVPFEAQLPLPPTNGFWIHDERLVVVEDWHAELWLDDAESVALYGRVWDRLNQSAHYGEAAYRILRRAHRALGP
ncbi:helix-turn-helix domain-containing protein [Streptomyces mayteni]